MGKVISLHGSEFYRRTSMTLLEKGLEEVLHKNYEQALYSFKEAYRFNNDNEQAYFYIGLVSYIVGDVKESMIIFKQLVELHPNNQEYMYRYARGIYEMEGENEEKSQHYFLKIKRTSPYFFQARLFLARLLIKQKKFKRAEILLRYLVEHDGYFQHEYLFELASISILKENYNEALRILHSCIQRNPAYPIAYYVCYDLYMKLGEKEKAVALLNRLVAVCPKEKDVAKQRLYMSEMRN